MTFNSIVIKGIKKGFRKYLAYYLSGSFCIALFFIFGSLLFNETINNSLDTQEYPLMAYFVVSIIFIGLFSIVFITYAHFSFIKNRHKEFGIYMTSGMTNRNLNKLLLIEIAVIFSLSMITGLLTGTVFSKVLQLVVCRLLELDNIKTNLSIMTYLITLGAFVIIYTVVFLISYIRVNKMDINSLLYEGRKREIKKPKTIDYFLALLGIGCTLFSVIFMVNFASNTAINTKLQYMLPYIITTVLGLILLPSYFVRILIYLTRKTKIYKRNLLGINQIENRFKQNSKVIQVLTIMTTLIICSIGASLALVSITDTIVVDGSADIEYVVYDSANETINQIIDKEKNKKEEYEFYYLYDETETKKVIVNINDYNKWNNASLSLNDNECINAITTWEPGDHGISVGNNYTLHNGEEKYTYTVVKSQKALFFSNNLLDSFSVIILSNENYQKLINTANKGVMYKISYEIEYKETKEIVEELKTIIDREYVFSRFDNYRSLKSGYSTFLFVAITQSLMFVISAGCVVFFKQSNELEQNKKEYDKVYRIGISDKEVKKVMTIELAIVYYAPLLLGLIFGLSIDYYMLNLFSFGNDSAYMTREFMTKGVYAWLGNIVLQTVFFLVTKAKYNKNVLNS